MYMTPLLSKYRLGSGQYRFLLELYNNNGLNQDGLADIVKMGKATTAKAVKKLEEEGYILRKTNNADKRFQYVYTTEKAENIREHLEEAFHAWDRIMFKGFTTEEKEIFKKLINRIGTNVIKEAEK